MLCSTIIRNMNDRVLHISYFRCELIIGKIYLVAYKTTNYEK